MADNVSKKARVRASGKIIEVYMHRLTGDWIDAFDCSTMYKTGQLEFI